MKKLLLLTLIAGTLAACSKDKFKTVPQVKITSFGPAEVRKAQVIKLEANITDAEGDLQDTVVIVRKRYNGNVLLTTDSSIRVSLKALGVPVKREVQLQFSIPYGEQLQGFQYFQSQENGADRNFTIGVLIRDNAGNRSEYAESEKIVLKKI